jgi:hypothetical protein
VFTHRPLGSKGKIDVKKKTDLAERERQIGGWLNRDGYLLFKGQRGGYGIGPDNGSGLPTTIGWDYDLTLDDVADWIERAETVAGGEALSEVEPTTR